MNSTDSTLAPDFTLADVEQLLAKLARDIVATPLLRCHAESELHRAARDVSSVALKLELMQIAGSFKIRGVLSNLAGQSSAQLARGVTAVSAGNHAIAVSFAARRVGISAKVVMPKSANPRRVEVCRSHGADVILADDVHAAFGIMEAIARDEGRYVVHPFEGRAVAMGTATLGLELLRQAPNVDAIVVPIGGGGLCAGVATVAKAMKPACEVFGVEPFGADSMYRSFAAGAPQALEKVATIADSLGAPFALPYSFALCRAAVSEIVRVSDDELRAAMRLLFRDAKLAVEPAAAASTAAFCGPLASRLAGRNVALIVSGTNLDAATYWRHLDAPSGA